MDALEYIAEDDLEIALELEQHDVKRRWPAGVFA